SGGGHHPSLLFVAGSPEPAQLPSTGPMIGLIPDVTFPSRSCPVPSGSRLLIFSDGVFEIMRGEDVVWDLPDCISYLASISGKAESLMDDLMVVARRQRGSQQIEYDFSMIEVRME